MTLFEKIKNDPAFQNPQDFIYLLLRRLSIAEAEIIFKPREDDVFQNDDTQDKMIISEIDNKCKDRQYSVSHSDVIIELFREITVLVGLIKDARFNQSINIPATGNIKAALALANTIIQETGLKLTLKDYAALLTEQMLDSLNKPECITSLDVLFSLLQSCFPGIDELELNFAVGKMRQQMDELKLAQIAHKLHSADEGAVGDEIGEGWVDVADEEKTGQHLLSAEGQKGYINNNIFEKSASNAVPSLPSIKKEQERTSEKEDNQGNSAAQFPTYFT